jgi:protein-S-isoprenylcysteine O-methyltransferase Ste14
MKPIPRAVLADAAARAIVGTLFALLSINLLADFLKTGHITGLMLLASESLVLVFTIVRRRAVIVDRSLAAGAVTLISLVGPVLLRVGGAESLAPDTFTAGISAAALGLVILGKIALGRSFGLVPANRGVVIKGPYKAVRHPIYAGYLAVHAAFIIANPRLLNIAVVLVADTALIARALFEERVLGHDAAYRAYCKRVGWHLVPGLY